MIHRAHKLDFNLYSFELYSNNPNYKYLRIESLKSFAAIMFGHNWMKSNPKYWTFKEITRHTMNLPTTFIDISEILLK